MKFYYFLFATGLCVCACSRDESTPTDTDIFMKSQASEFLNYLINKNERVIAETYANNSPSLTNDGKLNESIFNFLYSRRDERDEYKDVISILSGDDPEIKAIRQENGTYIVLFTVKDMLPKLEDINFLGNQWMKSYFACWFEIVGERIQFYQNFCFAETDGPFPPEYDI